MKTEKINWILAGVLLAAAVLPAYAQQKASDENKLEVSAGELDKKYSEGQDRVAEKIKAQFAVNDALLMGLHYRKLSNGEIAITLAMAQSMHRGITDKNLHTIVTLRKGPPPSGWSKIAKDLGIKLGPVISKVQKICAEVRKQEKTDTVKKEKAEEVRKNENNRQPGKIEKAGMKSLSRQ